MDAVLEMPVEDLLEYKLTRFLRATLDKPDLSIGRLERKSTGMSRENWTFAVMDGSAARPSEELILRRDPVGGMLETDRRAEYEILARLRAAGLPIPAVIAADLEGRHLDRPSLIMEIALGDCEYNALNGGRPLAVRMELAEAFLQLLVDMQHVDWRAAGLSETLENPGANPALHELGRWGGELARVALEPMPEMELIGSWLKRNARPARKIVVVHGDFKPGNALIHRDRISAMLDWETAHLGDPLEDLGWITNPARASEHQIKGHWERADIVRGFEQRTGYAVDHRELHWWNVFSCWKLAIIVLTGLRSTVDGKFDRMHHNPTWLYRRMLKMVEF
ncbi:Predicted kinase, aminoglycoside phosphotransferase (APT) family [Sphingobium faniae]|nr:Predicted kinase, aminoglycoside phosphotransferase (APT) family [Sphingobium faniae]